MSTQVIVSRDLSRIGSIVVEEFGRAVVDDVAPAIAREWKAQIVELDVIDTGNYLQAVRVEDTEDAGDVFTVNIEARDAAGYAGVIRRKGESDYVGRRVAEQGIERADASITAALDKAGDRVKG